MLFSFLFGNFAEANFKSLVDFFKRDCRFIIHKAVDQVCEKKERECRVIQRSCLTVIYCFTRYEYQRYRHETKGRTFFNAAANIAFSIKNEK